MWIGCGGCFSILILIVIVLIALGTFSFHYAQNIQKKMDAWHTETNALNQAYPFHPPENNRTKEDRYLTFLKVREQTIAAAEKKLDWLFQFITLQEKPSGVMMVKLGIQFLNFFVTLSNVGVDLTHHLAEERMSMNEYVFLTRLTAGTLYAWLQSDQESDRKSAGQDYFKAIDDLSNQVQRIKADKPGAHIDIGPLNRDKVYTKMQKMPVAPEEVDDLLFAHRAQINSSSATVFVDIFIIERND